MERPLVAFPEDVRGELLRGAVIGGQEIAFVPPRVAREDVRHALHVRARQIPGEIVPRRPDTELTFGEIDRLDSRFQGETE